MFPDSKCPLDTVSLNIISRSHSLPFYWDLVSNLVLGPKKKNVSIPVTRPSLFFGAYPVLYYFFFQKCLKLYTVDGKIRP